MCSAAHGGWPVKVNFCSVMPAFKTTRILYLVGLIFKNT